MATLSGGFWVAGRVWRSRKAVIAGVTVSGSSTNGQWPLRSSMWTSALREGVALALGERGRQVRVVAAPEHERGPVERAQRGRQLLPGGGDVGHRAVELEDGAPRVAVEVVVHAVHERPREPAWVAAPQQQPEAGARGGGHEQLAEERGAPDARERVPAIAGQRAGAQQDRGGEAVGVLGRPAQAPRAAEVVHDQVGAVDGEGVERPADEGGVRVHGLAEPGRRPRAAEAGRVPGHGPPSLSDGGEQRFPVGARAGVAVHEHDGLATRRQARPRAAGCTRRRGSARVWS